MRLIREIPTGPAVSAVLPFTDPTGGEHENTPFFHYLHDNGLMTMRPSGRAEEFTAHFDALPDVPASAAWRAAIENQIALSEADQWRPFDTAVFNTDAEQAAIDALDALIEEIEDGSPLLTPVVDALYRVHPSADVPVTLGAFTGWVAAVTGEALLVGEDCGEYDHEHDGCAYRKRAKPVPWEHVEFIAPGTQERVAAAVAALTADLPEIGEDDPRARYPEEYLAARDV